MRRVPGRLDWGVLTVAVLCLVAVLPWLTRPGLPAGSDAEIHVPRVAEFARVLADGVLYPRWAPDFYLGYGYPLFNFYAPLVYYLAQPFYWLIGATGAVKALFVTATWLAGLGMYAFARRSLGQLAGVVAAAAFVYAPYLVLIDPFVRVDLAEYFALAWMPWVLWGFDRLRASRHRANVAPAALLLAALALTHNLMLMLFAPLLAAYLLFGLLRTREPGAWGRVIGAGALAVGLSAVFWLPALAEKRYVILDQVIGYGDFDFHRHFLTLRELLRPAPILDQGALNPPVAYNLGLAQWVLGLVGWLVGWLVLQPHFVILRSEATKNLVGCEQIIPQTNEILRALRALRMTLQPNAVVVLVKSPEKRRAGNAGGRFWTGNFMGLAAVAMCFLTLPASAGVWEAIPVLRYVQFPWRLLGVAALPVAWLVGISVAAVGERWRAWAASSALALLLVGALPTLYPPPWTPLQANWTPRDMIQLELDGVALGTTANREYTPIWATAPPEASGEVLTSYETDGPVDRFDRQNLPPGASIQVVSSNSVEDVFKVTSAQPFSATVRRFYFPGWRAWVDEAPVSVAPGKPHGFITLSLPAGTHTLKLRLGSTPPRSVGTIASLLSLLALVGLAIRKPVEAHDHAPPRNHAPLVAAALIFFVVKVGVVDRQPDWFRVTSTGNEVAVARHALTARFEGQIALLGYDLPQTSVAQDGVLPLTLYWKTLGPVSRNYSVFVHLIRPAVHTWGQDDRLNPGDVPTTRWPADRYVRDAHRLGVLPGTPPGAYQIEVGLYEPDTGRRLFVLGEDGAPKGQGIVLPQTVQVTRAGKPFPPDQIEMQGRIGDGFGGQVTLLGYELNPTGDLWLPNFCHVTLFWQAEQERLPDLQVALRLRDEAGRVPAEITSRPVDGDYPAPQWPVGALVRDQYSFWLTEDFAPGRYAVEVSLLDVERGTPLEPVGGQTVQDGWLFLTQIEVRKP